MRCWLFISTTLLIVGLIASPASSQAELADPGLDVIMRATPSGYQRAERDRLPAGPMTAGTFNRIGATAVPVRADNAVVYGASYERSDGAIIIFLGMSSADRDDGQAFADRVIEGSLTNADHSRWESTTSPASRVRATALAAAAIGSSKWARLRRHLVRRECPRRRSRLRQPRCARGRIDTDAIGCEIGRAARPVAVAFAAAIAIVVFAIAAIWRFVRRRRNGPSSGEPTRRRAHDIDAPDTFEHPVAAASPRPSPRPTPR